MAEAPVEHFCSAAGCGAWGSHGLEQYRRDAVDPLKRAAKVVVWHCRAHLPADFWAVRDRALRHAQDSAVLSSSTHERHSAPAHTCHAMGCAVEVPPKLLMCKRHWAMVPKSLRDPVWSAYRRGQEVDKQPSADYLAAATAAIRAVAEKEGRVLSAAQGRLL